MEFIRNILGKDEYMDFIRLFTSIWRKPGSLPYNYKGGPFIFTW